MTSQHSTDILIIGGGPAGSAAAYWSARAGHDVVLLERDPMPRARPCGDALTPRAVGELYDMGLRADLAEEHRHLGLRMSAHGRSIEIPWPTDAGTPDHGLAIRRERLDDLLVRHSVAQGGRAWTGVEATEAIVEQGHLRGCRAVGSGDGTGPGGELVVRARFVVIADGPISAFGRALGTARRRNFAQGIARRSYFASPRHDDPFIESAFDLRDGNGDQLPGYGWVFPLGDGTVNVGVGLLSHHHGNDAIGPEELFEQWIRQLPTRWRIDPDAPLAPAEGGRLPMGASVHPRSGPNWVVAGDAAGSVNPFNGDGIEPALLNGRLAASVLAEALERGDGLALRRYEAELEARYDAFYKLGRLATQALGRPGLMRRLTRLGIRSRHLTELTMRISSGLEPATGRGLTSRTTKIGQRVAGWIPNR